MSLTQFVRKHLSREPVVRLKAGGPDRGTVSIAYITWPFRDGYQSPKARGHTNAFECVAMAESFQALGYNVEIADHNNIHYVPPQDCRVAIDIHSQLERWHPDLPQDCQRVLHATGSHWLLWNQAELARLFDVQRRKGVALQPRRQVDPSRGIEVADHAVVLGNKYTMDSFRFTGKPITRVPISSAYEFEWPADRKMDEARKKFLWVGSMGMVHKGLDLALDAFAGMPEVELTVCGRPEKETDFYRVYEPELRSAPNIRFTGWMDMSTPAFMEIARTHAAVIYPSSAEGGAGSVIHCMHAGMIPIVTTEASVDIGDFGIPVAQGTVESVRDAIRSFCDMPTSEIERRARATYDHARACHTRELFRKNYEQFARQLAG